MSTEREENTVIKRQNKGVGGKHEVYSGKNPEEFGEWFDRLVALSEANEWGEAKTLKVLPTYLREHALQVHASVIRENSNTATAINTMSKVKALMLKKILPVERCMLWKIQFRGIKRESGEGIDAFVFRLRKQAQKAYKNIDEANREEAITQATREQFILGQNRELEYTLLKEKDSTTLEDLVEIAKKLEAASEVAYGGWSTRRGGNINTVIEGDEDVEDVNISNIACKLSERMEDMLSQVEQRFTERLEAICDSLKNDTFRAANAVGPDGELNIISGQTVEVQVPKGGLACFRCGMAGHFARECSKIGESRVEGGICIHCEDKPAFLKCVCSAYYCSPFCQQRDQNTHASKCEDMTKNWD